MRPIPLIQKPRNLKYWSVSKNSHSNICLQAVREVQKATHSSEKYDQARSRQYRWKQGSQDSREPQPHGRGKRRTEPQMESSWLHSAPRLAAYQENNQILLNFMVQRDRKWEMRNFQGRNTKGLVNFSWDGTRRILCDSEIFRYMLSK